MNRIAALLLGLVVASSCKNDKGGSTSPDSASTPSSRSDGSGDSSAAAPAQAKLAIRIRANSDGNGGRPLHVLVRATDLKGFVEQSYGNIVGLVVEDDPTVLSRIVVFPGTEQTITLEQPESETIAVYGLFTAARGTSWKRLFNSSESIELLVGRDGWLDETEQ